VDGVLAASHTSPGAPGGATDTFGVDAGKALLYQGIHDFFNIVPANLWATIDGKPIVVFYTSSYVSNYNQSTFDYTRSTFKPILSHTLPDPRDLLERRDDGCGLPVGRGA